MLINEDKKRRSHLEYIMTTTQKTQYASCWFLGDRESNAMWKLYSQKDGVVLKFRAKEESFENFV